MKKITLTILTSMMLFALTPLLKANTINIEEPTTIQTARATVLLQRLTEIKEMKLENLNSSDKKKLRSEVKSIKSELKEISGGVYLSVGAIIVILILLLLLL
jgi:hypothetical protein